MNPFDVLVWLLLYFGGIVTKVLLDPVKDYLTRRLKEFIIHRARSRYTKANTPSPAREFHCFTIGNFELSVMSIIGSPETPFHPNEVTIKYQPVIKEDRPDYPLELKAAQNYLIEECKRRYTLRLFADNVLPRLDNVEQGPENEQDKRGELNIYLSLTRFGTLCATNLAIDHRVIPKSGLASRFMVNQSIREAYCTPPYGDLAKSLLANAPGVEAVVISSNLNQNPKDQLIVRLRGQNVAFFRGYYQASASGYMSTAHCDSTGTPSPFITAIEEARQEIADSLILSPEDFNLIGAALQWQFLYPSFYGYIKTGRPVQELLSDFKRDAYEGYLFAIPFDPKSVLSHIGKGKWTGVSALAVISTLLAFYSRSEVEAIAKTLPAKTWKDFIEELT